MVQPLIMSQHMAVSARCTLSTKAQRPRLVRSTARRLVVKANAENPVKDTEKKEQLTMKDRMRKLGASDLIVSDICLGTMTFGQQNTDREADDQLRYAFDQGINFLDTAEMYPVPTKAQTQGLTDKYIALWLKSQRRDDVVLATKVAGFSPNLTYLRDNEECVRVNQKQIMESVEKSLERLNTDYIDLLQIHWPDRYVSLFGAGPYNVASERKNAVPFEEQLAAFDTLIRQGKVRYMGVSNETSFGVMEFVNKAETKGLPKIVSIQNVYNLLSRVNIETDLAEVISPSNCNVGLLAYSPLAGGALSGKYLKKTPEGSRFTLFPGYMDRYNKSRAKEATIAYAQVAENYGMNLTAMSLAFCKSRWFVASTIIGATKMDQLQENIDAFDLDLAPECLADIEKIYRKFKDPAVRED